MITSALNEVVLAASEVRMSAQTVLQASEVVASVAANMRAEVKMFLDKLAS